MLSMAPNVNFPFKQKSTENFVISQLCSSNSDSTAFNSTTHPFGCSVTYALREVTM